MLISGADAERVRAGGIVVLITDDPEPWVALTGPCPTCDGKGSFTTASTRGKWETDELPCTDCRDGRRIEPLYTECPRCDGSGWLDRQRNDGGCGCNAGRVLVGRGSIEVVPVVTHGSDDWPHQDVLAVGLMNGVPLCRLWLWRYINREILDHWGFGADLTLDPLPRPGVDFGIVIDCVEVAQ